MNKPDNSNKIEQNDVPQILRKNYKSEKLSFYIKKFMEELQEKTAKIDGLTRKDVRRILRTKYRIKVSLNEVNSIIDELIKEQVIIENVFGILVPSKQSNIN